MGGFKAFCFPDSDHPTLTSHIPPRARKGSTAMAIEDDVVEGDAGEAEAVEDSNGDKSRSQQSKAMNSMTDLVRWCC